MASPDPTLDDVHERCWTLLRRGAARAREPFHTPALGTVTDGESRVRTVVLRQAVHEQRLLICHTDARSAKVEELLAAPVASWLFYDARRKIQVRATGPTTVHVDDAVARECWSRARASSRRCYGASPGPGTPVDGPASGLSPDLEQRIPTAEETEGWFERFAVVRTRVDRLEWLWLNASGHRRARFGYDGEAGPGPVHAEWLIP